MCRGGGGQRVIDTGEKFRALAMQKIERAALDQRFQHFAIGDAGIEPAAEILQRLEVAAALALANGKLHCPFADILNRSQAKADSIVAAVASRNRSIIRFNFAASGDRGYGLRHEFQPASIYIRWP